MTNQQPTILLTLEDVTSWQEELRLARQRQQELAEKISLLERRIEGSKMFVSESVAVKIASKTATNGHAHSQDTSGISMFDAIRRVIQVAGRPLEPREIASAIKADTAMPEKIRSSHPNYLYTALKRMTDKTKLHRDLKGRYTIVQTNEAA